MIHYTIQPQKLSKSSVDEDVVVSSEEVYRKPTEAMFNMNNSICKEKHKSYYNDNDIDIMNECRTIVPSGVIQKPDASADASRSYATLRDLENNVAEIGINKAFMKAFTSIKRIPMFRQFDIWPKWNETLNSNDMPSLTLYMVEVANANTMFSKKHNLIYGKFLKKFIKRSVKCNILYYTQPSHIHKVDYKQIIEDLWAEPISENQQEDRRIKKTIANINFGLLEKSRKKGQKSKMFDTIAEVCHYQATYGGRAYAINGTKHEHKYTALTEEMRQQIKEWDFEDGW